MTDVAALARQAIYDWLDAVERLVAASDQRSLATLAQTELLDMTRAWRELLREHEPTEDRACRTCARRRRDRRHRCEVWASAHRLLIKGEAARHPERQDSGWSRAAVSSPNRPAPRR